MAHATVILESPLTGKIREAPIGFSWTVLCFSFFPPLFRNDWKWFAIMLFAFSASGGLSTFVFCFLYNKLYLKDLLEDGFKAKTISTGTLETASLSIGIQIPLLEENKEKK